MTADRPSPWTPRRIALALGCAAFAAVLLTIDGPGVTVDEPLDVRPGRRYLEVARARGWAFFDPAVRDDVFRDNKEHPPLGRWLLGVASTLGEPVEILLRGGPDPTRTYVVAGRVAPALVFGLLVGLVAAEAGRRRGRAAALGAGLGLMLMPRVFAHAHLGALDTFIAAAWTLALLSAARAVEAKRPTAGMAWAGLAWGLALLTKIHASLLPPIVLAWAVARLGPRRAAAPLAAWTGVGLAVFVAGWPWLWGDIAGRWLAYLGTGVDRVSIRVLYFGTVYADRDVPWHYPWFYAVATVPVGLLALGAWGARVNLRRGGFDPFIALMLGSMVAVLGLFSTRAPVYDGERLFLLIFPLGAIVVGFGFADLWGKSARAGRWGLGLLMLGQATGIALTHPFELSYYNALVGGLTGAERLGLELTYWGDAVDRSLVDRLAGEIQPGQKAALAPTLAPQQGRLATTPALLRRDVVLDDQEAAPEADFIVLSRREAYWSDALRARVEGGEVVAERSRQGVWLSRIIRPRKPKTP